MILDKIINTNSLLSKRSRPLSRRSIFNEANASANRRVRATALCLD
jgi:hypothetical protein